MGARWRDVDANQRRRVKQASVPAIFLTAYRPHNGSQYETFTRNTSCDGAFGMARRSRRKLKSPIGATSARFSFHTTYSAEPGRNSHRATALPRTLRKLKSGFATARVYASNSRVLAATSE